MKAKTARVGATEAIAPPISGPTTTPVFDTMESAELMRLSSMASAVR